LPQMLDSDPSIASGVCLSIAAYEPAVWVTNLLDNALRVAEESTRIALHLNVQTQYTVAQQDTWNSSARGGRVLVTSSRVFVERETGSILYAHLLNHEALASRWPNYCTHFVLQASNMMWARPSWEPHVRNTTRSLDPSADLGTGVWTNADALAASRHPFYQNVTTLGHRSWQYHEGSFFPADDVAAFHARLLAWLNEPSAGRELERDVLNATHYPEEFWLQNYVLNVQLEGNTSTLDPNATQLCLRLDDGAAATQATLDDLLDADPPTYWAIKRVERDVDNSVVRRLPSASARQRTTRKVRTMLDDLTHLEELWEQHGMLGLSLETTEERHLIGVRPP